MKVIEKILSHTVTHIGQPIKKLFQPNLALQLLGYTIIPLFFRWI